MGLRAALARLAHDDSPRTLAAFFQQFLAATLIVPTAASTGNVPADQLPIIGIQDEEGRRALLAFTDIEELHAWSAAHEYFAEIDGPGLVRIAVENDFTALVVNVGGPAGFEINREELELLRNDTIPIGHDERGVTNLLAAGSAMTLNRPAQAPDSSLVARIRAALTAAPEVRAAYLFDVKIGESEPNLTIGLDCDMPLAAARRDDILTAVSAAAQRPVNAATFIDIVLLDSHDLRTGVEQVGIGIYERL